MTPLRPLKLVSSFSSSKVSRPRYVPDEGLVLGLRQIGKRLWRMHAQI